MLSINLHFRPLLILSVSVAVVIATSSHYCSSSSSSLLSSSCYQRFSSPSSTLAFAASSRQRQRPLTTTTTTTSTSAWRTFLDSILTSFLPPLSNIIDETKTQRIMRKSELIHNCQSYFGQNSRSIRSQIESSIDKLIPYNPTAPNNNNSNNNNSNNNSASINPLLQRKWVVLWTSEKEINFFLSNGITNEITQVLSDGNKLENYIPFVKIGGGNGGFGVTGRIATTSSGVNRDDDDDDDEIALREHDKYYQEGDSRKIRTYFKFEKATLNLGRWGTYTFPPVGEGWFDTIYLDDDLRIDINSRNDILICRAE